MELFRERTYPEISSPEQLQSLFAQNKLFGFQNVREEVYHAGPGLSQSVLKAYRESPANAKMMMKGLKTTTEAMKLGSACHAAVFEPKRFARAYFTGPECDRRTKAGKELWNATLDANAGRAILAPDDVVIIDGIVQSLKTHPYFEYIGDGKGFPELSFYWNAFGTFCKARFDWITSTALPLEADERRIIFDLKTTEYGVTQSDVERTIRSLGYDIQAGWYLSAVPDATFVFIFAGKRPPYPITFYQVGPKMLEEAHAKIDELLQRHAQCTASNHWPTHSGTVIVGD